MSRRKKILISVALVFIGIQFIRPASNVSTEASKDSIASLYPMPDSVQGILKESCFDCHSNNTRYPWYAEIQPMGWWLARHIREGKAELNFDAFGSYSERRRISKLKSIQNSIKDGSMPLPSYTIMHSEAKLTEERKAILLNWTKAIIDSLIR